MCACVPNCCSASGNAYGKSTLDTSVVPQFRRNEKDTGSPEAQIAIWSCRIKQLSDHLAQNRKDHQCARGLQIILGKRRKMLEYLYKQDKYVTLMRPFSSIHLEPRLSLH